MTDQLELFGRVDVDQTVAFIAPAPETEDELIIDRLLNAVEDQHILKELLRGETFSRAAGIIGSSHPTYWMTCAKGIEVGWSQDKRMITPKMVQARVAQYRPKT